MKLKERSYEDEILIDGITDNIEYYCLLYEEIGSLTKIQLKDLKENVERLQVFNSLGYFYQWGVEVLNKCGMKYKGIKESKSLKEDKIEYYVSDESYQGFKVVKVENGKKFYLSKLAKNIEDSTWNSDHTYAKYFKNESKAQEIVDILNSLKESKSLKEGKGIKKSVEIIRRKLMELINNDTIQEEFNYAFINNGIYDSVDDMFETSVHNVLHDLLKDNTITIVPF